MKEKIIIYQALVRLFGNGNTTRVCSAMVIRPVNIMARLNRMDVVR